MNVLLGLMTVMSMLSVRIPRDHSYATVGRDLKATEDHVEVDNYSLSYFVVVKYFVHICIAYDFIPRYQGVFSGSG